MHCSHVKKILKKRKCESSFNCLKYDYFSKMELEYDKEILELVCKPIKNDLNCLISITGHKLLKADLVIFKVILRKWFNRFHTSQISRRFSLVCSIILRILI